MCRVGGLGTEELLFSLVREEGLPSLVCLSRQASMPKSREVEGLAASLPKVSGKVGSECGRDELSPSHAHIWCSSSSPQQTDQLPEEGGIRG